MILDPQLVSTACDSPVTTAVVRQMAVVQALRKIAGENNYAAAKDAYVRNRAGAETAAQAEIDALTDDELRDLLGDFPHLAGRFVQRAFQDLDNAVGFLDLPVELVEQIDGHMVALYAAAMLVAEARDTQPVDDSDGEA